MPSLPPLDIIEITRHLVQINSENSLMPEDAVRKYVEELLTPYGFQFIREQFQMGRSNLLAILEPSPKSPLVLFSGHMDTVIGYAACKSAEASVNNGKIYGRGACDMKGGIASFLLATLQWVTQNKSKLKTAKYGIVLAFTVDEERGCVGINHMDSDPIQKVLKRIKYGILAEPTSLSPVYAHKGNCWYQIILHGKAAHGSVPEQGDNAISKIAQLILRLDEYNCELNAKESSLGHPTLNIGTIAGGTQPNVVPDRCELVVDRRFITDEDPKEEENILLSIAQEIDPTAEIHALEGGFAYCLPSGSKNEFYQRISKHCSNKSTQILPGYTEADIYFRKYHIPVVILGPGNFTEAHQVPEFVEIEQLKNAVNIYYQIINDFFTM
jgi:acetylornithine deacetylase/succinyl-diaminopimelate desuccinylase-like protein